MVTFHGIPCKRLTVCTYTVLTVATCALQYVALLPSAFAQSAPFYALSVPTADVVEESDFEVRYAVVGVTEKDGGWIGLYKRGAPDNEYVDWASTKGRTGSVFLSAKEHGTYEARFHLDRKYDTKAKSLPFVVHRAEDLPTSYSVTVQDKRIVEGGRVLVAWQVTGKAVRTGGWIGLYERGSENSEYTAWIRATKPAGTATFRVSDEGVYEVRYFEGDSYKRKAVSHRIDVVSKEERVTLSVSVARIAPDSISARWTAVGGNKVPNGWVGLYKVGAPDNLYLAAHRADGTAGTVHFVAPGPGTYEVRYHAQDSYLTETVSHKVILRP